MRIPQIELSGNYSLQDVVKAFNARIDQLNDSLANAGAVTQNVTNVSGGVYMEADTGDIYGDLHVYGNATVDGKATVGGDAEISGNVEVWGESVYHDIAVFKDTDTQGDARFLRNQDVYGITQYHGDDSRPISRSYDLLENSGEGTPLPDDLHQVLYLDRDTKALTTKDAAGAFVNYAPAPIGSLVLWPSPIPPDGYLLADGSAVSRSEYSTLYGIVGTAYGAGDGSTTFNLPQPVLVDVET